jgi:phosphoglycolate phosphatase
MIVVFDLDGTLIDSVTDLANSATELVAGLGGRTLDTLEVAVMVGDGAAALVQRALEAAGLDPATPGALARFLEIYDRRMLETTRPYDGVTEMLQMASGRARLAVLTNKPEHPSRRILQTFGLASYFETIVGGDGPLGRKPDPSGLHELTAAARVSLLVGDSPIDEDTARRGGIPFVWARYGFGAARFGPRGPDTPYVLGRPADLPAVLDRVAAMAMGA